MKIKPETKATVLHSVLIGTNTQIKQPAPNQKYIVDPIRYELRVNKYVVTHRASATKQH